MRVRGIHHVQITAPVGAEVAARAFYRDLLGLEEIAKPTSLAGRGGLWLRSGALQLHIGTEEGVDRPATKAHVAYEVSDLPAWRARLEAAGCRILENIPIPGYDRFETRDPFGNRIELIELTGDDSLAS
jgi:catechol 2,3-dioxygenase-like lactoylglutathione lyase family enzyme